jgi:DNA uptake protein ComE-like DNA-binding protein
MKLPRLRWPDGWTPAQRGVLIGIAVLLALYVGIRFLLNPRYVPNPQLLVPDRAAELADRLDPNTATADELAALPQIGAGRARDIVSFREKYLVNHPNGIAFEEPNDLLAIRGIGAAILQQARPFLLFPSERATTSPAPD